MIVFVFAFIIVPITVKTATTSFPEGVEEKNEFVTTIKSENAVNEESMLVSASESKEYHPSGYNSSSPQVAKLVGDSDTAASNPIIDNVGSASYTQTNNAEGAGYGSGNHQYGQESGARRDYKFNYEVNSPQHNTYFGHREQTVGDDVKGSYYVRLPDGKIQIVEYVANKEGYNPDIRYETSGGAKADQNDWKPSQKNTINNLYGQNSRGNMKHY